MPPRMMFLVSTNNRIDRDGEIVTRQALEDYVRFAHDEAGAYIGNNDLLWWHGGQPIGRVLECEVIHGFLVEIAVELENALVTVGKEDKIERAYIADIWDMIEYDPRAFGVSQGFEYFTDDKERGLYHRIFKKESSVLPIQDASNIYTLVQIFG